MTRSPERVQARVFGEVADAYHRTRPDYPEPVLREIVESAAPVERALEVGAGTGKATDTLIDLVPALDVVEPDADMAAGLTARLGHRLGRVQIATFEDAELEAGGYDLIVAAQCWHWVDRERGAPTAHRALRPGGMLALVWNRPEPDAGPRRDAIDDVYERHAPHLSARTPGRKGYVFDEGELPRPERDLFDRHHTIRHARTIAYDAATYCDLMDTQSNHRLLEPAARTALLDGIAAAIDAHGGTYEVTYTTVGVLAARR